MVYLVLTYFFLVFFVVLIIFMICVFFSKKMVFDFQSSSPFECGFNSMSVKRLPFSIHFFLVAVIFLIFDIEVVIIFPVVIVLKYSSIYVWFFVLSFFILVLILGLYHEWYNGILNWTF
uniref:NADH-ubiquinone oxidoreductase chain 3 n=1 Tax=Petalocephala chlorophana TaxID=2501810 RepID=A0A7L8XGE3_9HEMI|nr:NADH dehydrogenase subunit 3 [Petalocephala chlorophana]QOH91205.1 NADH dehydrogenase subunit 3 [Petalocephala chlorophana]